MMNDSKFSAMRAMIALALILCCCLAIACANKPAEKQIDLDKVDVNAVYNKLIASGKLIELIPIPERDLFEVYGIDGESVKQYVFAQSENYAVKAGEVAIFEAKEEAGVAAIKTALENHLNQIKNVAKNYSDPAQYEKIKPVEVKSVGKFVYFVVGEDYSALMQIMKDNIG